MGLAPDRGARRVEDLDALAGHDRMVALVEIGDAMGERRQRQRIRPDEVLAVAVADGERRATPGGDEQVVLALEEKAERERALEPRQRHARRLHRPYPRAKRAVAELDDGLGVGVAGEDRAVGLELGAQRAVVLDDAVMHHGDPPGLVRVRVALARRAVRRPAGMADAGMAADRILHEQVGERDQLAHRPPAAEAPLVHGRDAGAVVAAILEPLQRLEDQRRDLVAAEDRDDPAHQEAAFPAALSARSRAISRSPRPGFTVCRPRPSASAPAGTSAVITEPAATSAPSPIETGATSAEFEPMKARAPISVRCLKTPS